MKGLYTTSNNPCPQHAPPPDKIPGTPPQPLTTSLSANIGTIRYAHKTPTGSPTWGSAPLNSPQNCNPIIHTPGNWAVSPVLIIRPQLFTIQILQDNAYPCPPFQLLNMGPWHIIGTQHQLNNYETTPPLESGLLATITTPNFNSEILVNAETWQYKIVWIQLTDYTRYKLGSSVYTLNSANLRINTAP